MDGEPDLSAHAVIGEGRSTALVTSDGAIDWLCWPEPASPALFAALLDPRRGGRWSVTPSGPAQTQRSYVEDTNVLVTTHRTPGGSVSVTDFMAIADEQQSRDRLAPEHLLVRRIRGEAGAVELAIAFEPRPDFGARRVPLRDRGKLGLRLELGAKLYTLASGVPLVVDEEGARATVRIAAGETIDMALAYDEVGPGVLPLLGRDLDDALARTTAWWRRWAAATTYRGPWRAAVVRSALTVKLLGYAPSGAIVAAPTTSLPERVGSDHNWDYRFCWLRDAAFTTRALWDLGCHDDGAAFTDWLLHASRVSLPRVDVLYDVHGRAPPAERVLPWLAGHRESRPVRTGNAASDQVQLDVYGETIDAVAQFVLRTGEIDRATRRLLRRLGDFVCAHWCEPDQGIWEPRTPPQHRTHSRVLSWAALDRLLELHDRGLLPRVPVERWQAQRAAIRRDVEAHGFDERLGSYTQTFGGGEADTSLLLLGWYGFHPPDHPRLRGTFELVRERLEVAPGLFLREDASRERGEGAFGISSFWVAEYLARGGGSIAEAEAVFTAALGYANDVGLFAEEIDPHTGRALGNFPQAYTHVGLVNAALSIAAAHERKVVPAEPPLAYAGALA
ncbi:MAG TPA: glycoside hydrolase family 15 protein [Nannocystaceae bacterium]|nr:glycoside hydrolase family 15 protein [Nannocystaceae bacterium]